MRPFRVLSLLILLGSVCFAQCPLKFGKVDPNVTESWNRFGRTVSSKHPNATAATMLPDFEAKVQNVSGKDIRGLKVQAAYYDATEDLKPIPVEWNWQSGIKAGAEKTLRWENLHYDKASVGWLVVPTKILFEDGTKWEAATADSLSGCYGEFWKDKKHPRLTELPSDLIKPASK